MVALWLIPASLAIVYGVLVLHLGPQVEAASGGRTPFDLRVLGYDLAATRDYLTVLTPEGRDVYLGPVRVVDTLVPLLFGLTLWLPIRRRPLLWALPAVAYALFDLSENAAVADLLRTGPTVEAAAVSLASSLTISKFVAFAVAIGVALYGLWAGPPKATKGKRA